MPFTYLPAAVAEWLWVGLSIVSAALALRLVGVRDWRVYGAALLAPAVGTSLSYGTVQCVLMLGLAATWRWRDHAWRGGLALGALIAMKLIFVPLIAWLLLTRRFACAAIAGASAAGLCLAAWAVIGFDGFTDYPHVLSLLTQIEKAQGFSSGSYVLSLGLGDSVAAAIPYVLGCGVLALLWIAVRRGGARADAYGFLLGTLSVIAFSPIVWLHYLALLLVPVAVLRPEAERRLARAVRDVGHAVRGLHAGQHDPPHRVRRRPAGHRHLRLRAARIRRAPEWPASPRSWHTARMAMRPTHRVRIEYCVP